ncbi:tail fiber protein [Thalassobaculum sp. OXR-137]|uniref:phage tail protein n=1 Tax=Thalassobaculum sp. OXR-137 TaxID=3100173 RepID=UPI002AC97557|nr:tail fiber protein [Thalassobaculum sp. OXR-137]WPZ36422.1 tail fiber protein [Thalassobaculum sp. OXR-137]
MTLKHFSGRIRETLAVCCVAVAAAFPNEAKASCGPGDSVYIGSVCITAASFCPRGYASMEGQLIAISENSALFSLLGCTWGGDCRTSFAYPDMRGRAPIGVGTGPGLTSIQLGQWRGAETHTLTGEELAQHDHAAEFTAEAGTGATGTLMAYTARASTDTPATGSFISGGGGTSIFGTGGLGAQLVELGGLTIEGGESAGGTVDIGDTGSSEPFNIQGPVMGLKFCIATEGIYPPRT